MLPLFACLQSNEISFRAGTSFYQRFCMAPIQTILIELVTAFGAFKSWSLIATARVGQSGFIT